MPLPTVEPYVYVDAPEIEPYKYGLFGTAAPLTLDSEHWMGWGVEWESLASYAAALYPAGVLTSDPALKRTVADGVLNGTTTLTSATAAFVSGDAGKRVTETAGLIPAGTVIASVTNGTTVILSAAATGSGSSKTIAIFEKGGLGGTKTLPSVTPTTKAFPFSVYGGVLCGSLGYTNQEAIDRALTVIQLAGQHAAESALWTGGGGNVPALNASSSTTVAGTAAKTAVQIGTLERWIANNYNGRGFLHVTRDVYTLMVRDNLCIIDEINETAKTKLGTRVIASGGGNGTGPSASAPPANQSWAYATGLVTITRDQPFTPAGLGEALDRSGNQVSLLAEQVYMIGIDGPVGAALVDITL